MLVMTNVQLNQAGNYAVLVTNVYGSIMSSNAALIVLAAPLITRQPVSQTNFAGTTTSFTTAAVGTLPLIFQWQKNGLNLNDGGNVFGATTTNLTLSSVQDADVASYSVMVTNVVGSITSSPALLVVLDPPSIVSQPISQLVTLTSNMNFSVNAAGSAPLNYQWNLNGTNIGAGTNAILALTNVQLSQAGNYSVWVTNNYGAVLSSNAALVVNPLYHFVWNVIPSPRFINTPFAVVVQAQNTTNGIATNFTSTVAVSSTNGFPVIPALSANFIQGVWTGAVTVAQLATNLVFQATDNFGESGIANPIDITDLPVLTTVPSGGTLLMLWPVNPSGFRLETTPQLFPAHWVPITTSPFQIGDQNLVPLPTSATNAFYRLHFSGQ
jgi:hypothetical protein